MFVAVGGMSLGACEPSLATYSPDHSVQVTETRPAGACFFEKLLPSSDGRLVAVFEVEETFAAGRDVERPEGFAVFDIERETAQQDDRSFVFTAGFKRLRPIAWNGSEILFKMGGDSLAKADHAAGWATVATEIPEPLQSFEFTSTRPVGPNELLDGQILLEAENFEEHSSLRRRSVHFSDELYFSALDLANKQHLLFGPSFADLEDLGASAFYNRFEVASGSNGQRYFFVGSGVAEGRPEPYSRPLINYQNATVIGSYRPNAVSGFDEAAQINAILSEQGLLIVDATAAGERVFLLAQNRQEMTLIINDGPTSGDIKLVQVCQKDRDLPGFFVPSSNDTTAKTNRALPRPEFSIPALGDGHTTGVLFPRLEGVQRNLVVYFRGGPGGSNYKGYIPPELNQMRERGYDVLAVEYSGSVGAGLGLSMALAEKPMFGFESDSIAVQNWMDRQGYESAVLYAASFGAAPAMVFKSQFPDLVDRSVFLGPLLQLPSSDKIDVAGGPFFSPEKGSQIQYELGVFGGPEKREEFASWLRSTAAQVDTSQDDLFIFGELDMQTPISSAPQNITGGARVLVVPNATHQFVGSGESTRNQIVAHLLGEPPDQAD